MRELGVAIWGLGPHALRNLVPAVRETSGLALRGVCSRNAEVVARAAAGVGCAGWTDPAVMLADPAVEAVYLSTPIGLHADQGRAVLAAGKHLWCEKPLAANANEWRRDRECRRPRHATGALGEDAARPVPGRGGIRGVGESTARRAQARRVLRERLEHLRNRLLLGALPAHIARQAANPRQFPQAPD